jgi:LEA14-like dessication related protein
MRWMKCMAVLVLAAALSGCGEPAQVSFGTMCIERLGIDATDYAATIVVPNKDALKVEELDWRLTSGGQIIAEKHEARSIELPGEKATAVIVRVQVPASSLAAAGLAERPRFDYQFTGQLHVANAFGGTMLPFGNSGRMPVIQPLDITLQSVERVSVSETHVNIVLSVAMTNGNDIALTPTALEGDMLVNNRPLIVLDTPIDPRVSVPPRGTSIVKIPVKINSAEFGVKSLETLLTTPGTLVRVAAVVSFRGPGEGDVRDMVLAPATQPE